MSRLVEADAEKLLVSAVRATMVRAPMHGRVLAVLVDPGATVTKGQRLAVIEARLEERRSKQKRP